MRTLQAIAGLWCIACVALVACGQEGAAPAPAETTAPAMPKPEPVLQHVPADALGFVVVQDVGAMLGHVDNYLAEVGLSEMVAPMMPAGALQGVKDVAMLGSGFNPSGGFAVVMLDPAKFDVDLPAMMGLTPPTTQPTSDAAEPKLPVVILVPGMSVEGVFGNYEIIPGEKYTQVMLRMGPMLATQIGGYVCLSPSAEALDALDATERTAAETLSPEEGAMLARSDIAFHVNMEAASPLVETFMTMAMQGAQQGYAPPMIKSLWSTYIGFYKDLLSQMTAVCVGGRFADRGVVVEAMGSFKPDSPMGQMLAAYKPADTNLLARVPDRGYVLAIGGAEDVSGGLQEQQKKWAQDMTDTLLASPPFSTLDEQAQADLKAFQNSMLEQGGGAFQMVVGPAPEGSGLFGVSMVSTSKDSAAVKELLLNAVPLFETIVQSFLGMEELPFDLAVVKDIASVEGLSVDAVEIVLPQIEEEDVVVEGEMTAAETPEAEAEEAAPPEGEEMEELAETEPAQPDPITMVMGEDKIRLYLVAVDPQTLVMTFGGGQTYLAEAVKVAKAGDGKILSDPALEPVLAEMPKNLSSIFLLNVGNLFDVVIHATTTMGGPNASPSFRINTRVPVACGSGVSGTTAHAVYYIPNELVKEGVEVAKKLMAPPTTMPSEEMPMEMEMETTEDF